MSGKGEVQEFARATVTVEGEDVAGHWATWALACAKEVEQQRVVDLIRAAIPGASVFYYDSVVSVRATPGGATRDVVLVPGDQFTVTSTTVIRRGQS